MFSGVPTMYMALNASGTDLRKHRLNEIRTYISGGAALPVNLKRAFEEEVGRPVFEGYALSEGLPVSHHHDEEDEFFYVVEGRFLIDPRAEERTVELAPEAGFHGAEGSGAPNAGNVADAILIIEGGWGGVHRRWARPVCILAELAKPERSAA